MPKICRKGLLIMQVKCMLLQQTTLENSLELIGSKIVRDYWNKTLSIIKSKRITQANNQLSPNT